MTHDFFRLTDKYCDSKGSIVHALAVKRTNYLGGAAKYVWKADPTEMHTEQIRKAGIALAGFRSGIDVYGIEDDEQRQATESVLAALESNTAGFTATHMSLDLEESERDGEVSFWMRDKWICVICDQSQEFSKGIGHRHPRKSGYSRHTIRDKFNKCMEVAGRIRQTATAQRSFLLGLAEVSTPKPPTAFEVLHAMHMDGNGSNQPFEDWCGDYGYDCDSIKALETYNACRKEHKKLRAIQSKFSSALSDSNLELAFRDY